MVTAANCIRLCQRKTVKLCFTQSALTHYPIEQLYNALVTVFLWRKLVVPMCKELYQEGDKLAAIVVVLGFLQKL